MAIHKIRTKLDGLTQYLHIAFCRGRYADCHPRDGSSPSRPGCGSSPLFVPSLFCTLMCDPANSESQFTSGFSLESSRRLGSPVRHPPLTSTATEFREATPTALRPRALHAPSAPSTHQHQHHHASRRRTCSLEGDQRMIAGIPHTRAPHMYLGTPSRRADSPPRAPTRFSDRRRWL